MTRRDKIGAGSRNPAETALAMERNVQSATMQSPMADYEGALFPDMAD
jgi:hypothetical protein